MRVASPKRNPRFRRNSEPFVDIVDIKCLSINKNLNHSFFVLCGLSGAWYNSLHYDSRRSANYFEDGRERIFDR